MSDTIKIQFIRVHARTELAERGELKCLHNMKSHNKDLILLSLHVWILLCSVIAFCFFFLFAYLALELNTLFIMINIEIRFSNITLHSFAELELWLPPSSYSSPTLHTETLREILATTNDYQFFDLPNKISHNLIGRMFEAKVKSQNVLRFATDTPPPPPHRNRRATGMNGRTTNRRRRRRKKNRGKIVKMVCVIVMCYGLLLTLSTFFVATRRAFTRL